MNTNEHEHVDGTCDNLLCRKCHGEKLLKFDAANFSEFSPFEFDEQFGDGADAERYVAVRHGTTYSIEANDCYHYMLLLNGKPLLLTDSKSDLHCFYSYDDADHAAERIARLIEEIVK